MKKIKRKRLISLIFIFCFVSLIVPTLFKAATVTGKEAIKKHHKEKHAPIRSLMFIISSHTTNILDALMMGDFESVRNEAKIVIDKSENLKQSFFPGGNVGKWIENTSIDANDPKMVKAVKKDIEKYASKVTESANKIIDASMKHNIVETYDNFDAMLREACFNCHDTYRVNWPEWPEWMQIGGG